MSYPLDHNFKDLFKINKESILEMRVGDRSCKKNSDVLYTWANLTMHVIIKYCKYALIKIKIKKEYRTFSSPLKVSLGLFALHFLSFLSAFG